MLAILFQSDLMCLIQSCPPSKLVSAKKPHVHIPQCVAALLRRWAVISAENSYKIEHGSTFHHVNADNQSCLSLKVTDNPMDEVNIFNIVQIEAIAMSVTAEQVEMATEKDPLLS